MFFVTCDLNRRVLTGYLKTLQELSEQPEPSEEKQLRHVRPHAERCLAQIRATAVAAPAVVRIVGLEVREEWPAGVGLGIDLRAVRFDEGLGGYELSVDGVSVLPNLVLLPGNLRLAEGSRVTVTGVEAMPTLNGQMVRKPRLTCLHRGLPNGHGVG